MSTLLRADVKEKLNGLKNGTIYSVTFTKKDGSVRLMNSIKGTSKGVNGVGLKYNPEEKGLIPVYDIQVAKKDPTKPEKAWRSINLNTISEVCVNKERYVVID